MTDENLELDGQNSGETPEKMLSQSEVNVLIGREKADAQARGRKSAELEYNQRLEQQQAQQQQAQPQGEETTESDADKIYQQVQERFSTEMQQRQMEDKMHQVANSYQEKMAGGGKTYEDFDTVVKDFDPTEFPQIVFLVADMDNAADVIYELSKNPSKLATIDYLSNKSPKRAFAELQRIGASISANQEAVKSENQAQVDSPLDRMQQTSRTGSNGQMSVTDLRNQPWLRA